VDPAALAHRLTTVERDQFEREGFLHLRGVLDRVTVERLHDAASVEDAAFRNRAGVGPHHVLNQHDLVGRDDVWLDLVDWPTTFPKVWGILGWHIQLFHTQLIVTPPAPTAATPGPYGWHQDNNRMNLDLETTPQPRVSVKIGYFLSDLPRSGMGNLAIVPGSHRRGRPSFALGTNPPNACEIVACAGDAVLFDRRLWHAATTNTSDVTRVFVAYGYSYRWLRPKSRMQHDELFDGVDPIRRQLLGWSSSPNGYFEPTDDDVPLRSWLIDNDQNDALAP
jgi:hypothetical protein